MLSQPDSAFNLREVMDRGMIFLANLSTIGSEAREDLGSLLLSQFHQAALTRIDTPPDKRRLFHLFCDEAHRFITTAVEDTIAETRKFGLTLTLAHQFNRQFELRKVDALANTGTTIVFNVGGKDARMMADNFRGRVKARDLIDMQVGDAVARIGTEVVRMRTFDRREGFQWERRNCLVAESRRRYCRPVPEVRDALRRRSWTRGAPILSVLSAPPKGTVEEFTYDEF